MRNIYLIQYLDALFETAVGHYRKIRKGEEVEAIHQLRVSLKKINAIFRLLAFIDRDTFAFKPAFQPLKELFDSSGTVRDLQIVQQVLDQYEPKPLAYFNKLNQFLNQELILTQGNLLAWKKEHTGIKHFETTQGLIKGLKFRGKAKWLAGCSGYIDCKWKKIARLLVSRKRDKWHRIRIRLKRIRFIMDWALTLDKNFVPSDQYKKVRLLGELLGDWHDRVIVVEMVRLQTNNFSSSQAQKDTRDFIKRLNSDQKALLSGAKFYMTELLARRFFSTS